MADPITLPASDFPDVVREGCALVLVRAGGIRRTATGPVVPVFDYTKNAVIKAVPTSDGDWPLDALAIDLTRPSGQWAVACWLVVGADRDWSDADDAIVNRAMVGLADPAELRRVALEVRLG